MDEQQYIKREKKLLTREIEVLRIEKELLERRHFAQDKRQKRSIPLVIAIFTAAFSIIGIIVEQAYEARLHDKQTAAALDQQILKNEQELILTSIVPDDLEKSRKNINFFLKAGFINPSRQSSLEKGLDSIPNFSARVNAKILYPKEGQIISNSGGMKISGEIAGTVPDDYQLWAFAEYKGVFYPSLRPIYVKHSGEWEAFVFAGINAEFRLCICVIDEQFQEYLFKRFESGDYKGIRIRTGIEVIDYVTINVKS